MAASSWPTINYPSTSLSESAGAILFDLASKRICILQYMTYVNDDWKTEYLLPKGRRNWSESRAEAAVREVLEETGYECELLDLEMQTRCPPLIEEDENTPDVVRTAEGKGEPFMLQVRQLEGGGVKLIWWYIAGKISFVQFDSEGSEIKRQFEHDWFYYDDAVARLTFEDDRVVVRKAIEIVKANYEKHGEEG
jgi:8-oxo-dGTP pyrophosphatase MutT (NUDIX family)